MYDDGIEHVLGGKAPCLVTLSCVHCQMQTGNSAFTACTTGMFTALAAVFLPLHG